MTEPATRPATPGWIKIVLALSVALNLVILGIVGGAFLKEGPRERGMPRDLSFGPFTEAFTPKDRRALRAAFMERADEFRAGRTAAQEEFANLIATLRADPFDAQALKTALAAIEKRNADRLAVGRLLIEERIMVLAPDERSKFADRLEKVLKGGGRGSP